MRNVTAGDIMIPLDKYPHIPHWFTLRQAIAEMEHSEIEINGRKSLPRVVLVFDEKYQLLGMVRRRDILRGLEPEFLLESPSPRRREMFDSETDPALSEVFFDRIQKGIAKRAERPVSEIMIPIRGTANFDDHIAKVVYEMNANKFSLLPVLKDSKVVGVVRTVDVFHEFAKILE
ncbi:MAG: CBS domain-containing protein [bacterium]